MAALTSKVVRPRNGSFTRQGLIEHHSERPQIASVVSRLTAQHFGRHVRQRAASRGHGFERLQGPRSFVLGQCQTPRQAEIQYFDQAFRRQDYVGALQVSVNNVSSVGVGQGAGYLGAVAHHRFIRQPSGADRDTQGLPSISSITM